MKPLFMLQAAFVHCTSLLVGLGYKICMVLVLIISLYRMTLNSITLHYDSISLHYCKLTNPFLQCGGLSNIGKKICPQMTKIMFNATV